MSAIVAVVGPTACGKTRRGVALARALDGEIVSADSRQIYRGMDIGTGKDLADYGDDVAYHMIDVAPAGYRYNLFEYLRDARAALDDISLRGKRAVVVGGTGMYVESLLKGMDMPRVPRNERLRASLAGKSLEELAGILGGMKRLHNNTDIDTTARTLRAIEIEQYYLENPAEAERVNNPSRLDALVIGIDIAREQRRDAITRRMRMRFEQQGMLDEVRRLLADGLTPDDLIYYGLEYKYLTLHLTGLISRADMERQLETAIHQFAKRQMTWFRGMERRGFTIHWLPFDMPDDEFVGAVTELLNRHEA